MTPPAHPLSPEESPEQLVDEDLILLPELNNPSPSEGTEPDPTEGADVPQTFEVDGIPQASEGSVTYAPPPKPDI